MTLNIDEHLFHYKDCDFYSAQPKIVFLPSSQPFHHFQSLLRQSIEEIKK